LKDRQREAVKIVRQYLGLNMTGIQKINQELHSLYLSHWQTLIDNFNKFQNSQEKPTNPLLLCVNEEYASADIKIMYFGQETNTWYNPFSGDVQFVVSRYKEFFIEGHFKHRGPFKTGIKKYTEAFIKELSGKNVGILWNNIIKIGMSNRKGCPSQDILFFQKDWFQVIREEIEILKPDIILFFTGPKYDQYVRECFPDFKKYAYPKRNEWEMARIVSSKLPKSSIRTYHPNYLFRKKQFNNYLNDTVTWAIDLLKISGEDTYEC